MTVAPDMQSSPLRIGVATFALALCVAAIILVGSAAERADSSWTRWTESPERHVTVQLRDGGVGWGETERLIRDVRGVRDVVPVLGGTLSQDDAGRSGWESVAWMAGDSSTVRKAFMPPGPGVSLWKGELPGVGNSDRAVVGYELARVMGLDLGDDIDVRGSPFIVGAIWSPSDSEAGNFVQVPAEAALSRFGSSQVGYQHLMVYIRSDQDTEEVARRIWEEVPNLQVSSPDELSARLREGARVWRAAVILLCVWTLAVGFVTCTYVFGRGSRREAGALSAGKLAAMVMVGAALAGIIGVLCGTLSALGLNVYGQRTYARTFLFLTPRLLLLAVGVALAVGALSVMWLLVSRGARGEYSKLATFGRGTHWAVAILVLGLGTWLLIMSGSVTESLYSSLAEIRQLAVRRVGLRVIRPSGSLLFKLAAVPGVEGLTAEAYGGAVDEDEEGWGDRPPPSGVLYGVASDGMAVGMSLSQRSGLWQGTGVRARSLDEAVISRDLAENRHIAVGDALDIRGHEFEVVGIRERCALGMPSDCNWRVDISLDALRRLTLDPYALDSAAILVPPVDREQLREAFLVDLAGRIPEAQIVSLDAQVDEVAVRYPLVRPLVSDQQAEPARRARFMYSIAYLVLVVFASLGMGWAVWAAVGVDVHRRRERIALEMALGAAEGNILSEQALGAASWSALGALLGVSLAVWSATEANAWISTWGIHMPRLAASPRLLVVVAIWTMVLAIVAAILPSLQGLRDDPLRLLVRGSVPSHEGVEL